MESSFQLDRAAIHAEEEEEEEAFYFNITSHYVLQDAAISTFRSDTLISSSS